MRKPPKPLDAEAKRFWKANVALLEANGTISDSDLFNFQLLCQDWSTIQRLYSRLDPDQDPGPFFMSLRKLFLAQSKAFGLVPDMRMKLKPPEPEPVNDLDAELKAVMGQ